MNEEELAARVRYQAEYSPAAASSARIRAWADDDPTEAARATGDRLWVVYSQDVAGPWLPPPADWEPRIRGLMPEAHLVEVEDGAVSRPDLTAAVIRRITGS
jgi:hypothetical protein